MANYADYPAARTALAAALGCTTAESDIATTLRARLATARGSLRGADVATETAAVEVLELLAAQFQAQANVAAAQDSLRARLQSDLVTFAAFFAAP